MCIIIESVYGYTDTAEREVDDLLKKVDPTVKRETCYIAGFVLALSAVMELVFALLGAWNITVLLGNLLGGFAAVLNFFLMGLTIQSALGMEEKDAKNRMKASQSMRMLMLLGFCVIGGVAPCFNLYAALIPLVFPRIAVGLRPMFDKKS